MPSTTKNRFQGTREMTAEERAEFEREYLRLLDEDWTADQDAD